VKTLTQKPFLLAVIAVASLLTLSPLNAQSGSTGFAIPFQFYAGSAALPAGDYAIAFDHSFNRILVSATGTDAAAWILPHRIAGRGGESQTARVSLLFHRYGDTYFLREVWSNGQETGFALPMTKAEKRAARQGDLRQVALIHPR